MSDINKYIPSVFKEKKWGKDVNGVNIIDGFVYRGNRVFGKVVEEFKELMKKGYQSDINGIDVKVLDSRMNGNGNEIDIEIVEKGNRGIAVLKLYGPSLKKDKNVVMINKNKESDAKYVTILAEKVIKPLMKTFLDEECATDTDEKNENTNFVTVRGKELKILKCPHCEKTSHSASGLKGHVTKMHSSDSNKRKREDQDEMPCARLQS